jgi:hypothetical protein
MNELDNPLFDHHLVYPYSSTIGNINEISQNQS